MDDLTLIFQNAMQYNDKESDYHKMADTLRKQARRTQQYTAAHSSTQQHTAARGGNSARVRHRKHAASAAARHSIRQHGKHKTAAVLPPLPQPPP